MNKDQKFRNSYPIISMALSPVLYLAQHFLTAKTKTRIASTLFRLFKWKPSYYPKRLSWGLNAEPRTIKITVSVTTYPGRIKTVHETIATLLSQTMKPDRVVLWLGGEKFHGRETDLPGQLLRLRDYGLTIEWCRDIRSYTKLIPALQKYPDDIIVTADDDMFYPPNWLEMLYDSYRSDPMSVHSHEVMQIGVEDGTVTSYNVWRYGEKRGVSSVRHLLLGVSGVLYPPRCFSQEVLNEEAFMKLAKTCDDLWFWAMAVLNGRKICYARNGFHQSDANPNASQATSLWSGNIDPSTGNDLQLKQILEAYPTVKDSLVSCCN